MIYRGEKILCELVAKTCDLLIKKQPISDDLLILCWKICESRKIEWKLLTIIGKIVEHSLSHKTASKKRDYHYFRKYLLNSNIFFQFINRKSNAMVFDFVVESLNTEVNYQKEFIKDKIRDLLFDPNYEKNLEIVENVREQANSQLKFELRQDSLDSNKVRYNTYDLMMSSNDKFDSSKEYDNNIYLTSLIVTAHALNNEFQRQMKEFVSIYNSNAMFQSAPVKVIQRCLIKSQTDYADARWPRSAKIIDLISMSLSAEHPYLCGVCVGFDHFLLRLLLVCITRAVTFS